MRRLAALMLFASGCGGTTPPETKLPSLHVDPPPTNGIQILLPIVRDIQPGTDNEICTWTDTFVDHDTDVQAVQGFQAPAGHHLILFSTTTHQPANTTRRCSDDDMSTFRFAAGAGGEGNEAKNEAPAGLT